MKRCIIFTAILILCCITPAFASNCGYSVPTEFPDIVQNHYSPGFPSADSCIAFGYSEDWYGYHPYLITWYVPKTAINSAAFTALGSAPLSGDFDLYANTAGTILISSDADWNWFQSNANYATLQIQFYNWNSSYFDDSSQSKYGYVKNVTGDYPLTPLKRDTSFDAIFDAHDKVASIGYSGLTWIPATDGAIYWCDEGFGPAATPDYIPVNIWEKYSYAVLVNQAVTVTPTSGGSGQTKTSQAGETIFFDVVPGASYWFNASRPGYVDYNQTYTIPVDPPQYNIFMSKTLSPVPGMNYTHFSVIDQTNGGMQQNARILLSDGQTKLTNSAGYTWFLVNQSTPYTYTVSKTGYMSATGSFNITADTDILVALQPPNVPTVIPSWTPITVPTTGTGPITTLSAQQREQNVQEGIDVWYRNISFISQFLFLLFILGGLGLVAGGMDRRRRR